MLNGGDDDDTLRGGTGDDSFYGGLGIDIVDGGAGSDSASCFDGPAIVIRLNGLPVSGHTGENDTAISIEDVITGVGKDTVFGSSSANHIDTGRGNDRVTTANDGAIDSARCGGGSDRVTASRRDDLRGDCETINRRRR